MASGLPRAALAAILDRLRMALFVIDRNARVLHRNSSASELLQLEDGLSLRGGVLVCSDPEETRELHQRAPAGGAFIVSRPSARPPWRLLLMRLEGCVPARAAVLIPAPPAAPPAFVLQTLHGLTAAEARVAGRALLGARVGEIAADLGVSVNTARTHLKRVYSKVGASREADLVRRLLWSATLELNMRPHPPG